jgi:hypothetical protein
MAEVCKVARWQPSYFEEALTPYTNVYEAIQSLLFWRRPIHFAVILVLVELAFFFVSITNLSFLAFSSLALAFYYVGRAVAVKFGSTIARLFPPIDKGKPTESNRIYPLLPFCQRFSHISSTFADFIERLHKGAIAGSRVDLIKAVALLGAAFLLFAFAGTFWPIFVVLHLVLLLPGVIMHPKVFPYAEPYILKFAEAIKCPYCHAKPE